MAWRIPWDDWKRDMMVVKAQSSNRRGTRLSCGGGTIVTCGFGGSPAVNGGSFEAQGLDRSCVF